MPVKGVSCGRQHGDSKLGACDSECVGHPLHLTRPLLFCPPTVGLGEMWWSSTGLAYPHPLLQSQACCTGWLPGRPQLCEEACSQPSYSAAAAAKKGKLPFGLARGGAVGHRRNRDWKWTGRPAAMPRRCGPELSKLALSSPRERGPAGEAEPPRRAWLHCVPTAVWTGGWASSSGPNRSLLCCGLSHPRRFYSFIAMTVFSTLKISNCFSLRISLPAFVQSYLVLLRTIMPSFISGSVLYMLIFKICQPALQNFIWSKFMC